MDKPKANSPELVVVIIPREKAPRVKNLYINEDGKAEVFITSKTTQKDALEGNNVYALSGYQGLIVTDYHNSRIKPEIESYLNNRFGSDWELRLDPIKK